ncbi:MAG TPA: alpha-amylase family protein [Opitutus sp.]|nr:alpha-amylase family protein [Opitutus sp.]
MLIGCLLAIPLALPAARADDPGWLRTARVFLVDAYQPPFAPQLEFDAEALAKTMVAMHANTVRIGTMGKYATIQGVRFSHHPDLGNRDALAEMIAAAKPRGIRVVPYISTGHKLAWSMVTRDHPEYAQQTRPGGGPARSHMYVGEDHGTVCWNTPYRQAYLDMVRHIVRDYDIDGIYFDTWRAFYFWPGLQVCYCDGCRNGFRKATGKELPWHENEADYTAAERATIDEYHHWYHEQLIGVMQEVRRIVKSYKDIPLIYNVNNPRKLATEDPRILQAMDAFLYERGHSLLQRAEGISLARAAGLDVWPYVGVYHNWPRIVSNGLDYQQEIFATAAFGGAPILAQPTGYVTDPTNRHWVTSAFAVLEKHERDFAGFENVPDVAVVYADRDPPGHAQKGWFWSADVRAATLGAFAACLYGHVQVASIPVSLLDRPEQLARYRVVYLADVPSLSPQQVANLKQFVENGGGLVASYDASLYSAAGREEETFALEDLLRVRPVKPQGELAETLQSYQCITGGPNDLYLTPHGSRDGALVPLWYFEPVETLPGATAEWDVVTGDGRRPILPGVVLSAYGRGKVVYLASSLESLYESTRQTDLGKFLRALVQAVAPAPPAVRVEAPSLVIANLTRNGAREVLHLLNWTGDSENDGGYLPPVENIAIHWTIPDGRKVRGVAALVDAPFHYEQSGRELTIRVPRLDAYQAFEITTQ